MKKHLIKLWDLFAVSSSITVFITSCLLFDLHRNSWGIAAFTILFGMISIQLLKDYLK